MRAEISSAALQQILAHAAADPGREVCGLLFGEGDTIDAVAPCGNVAAHPENSFEIDPAALLAAHRAMRHGGARLVGHYHSHPDGRADPSPRDAAAAAPDGMIWLIVANDSVKAWRAVADGTVTERFIPLMLDTRTGCAEPPASPEGTRI